MSLNQIYSIQIKWKRPQQVNPYTKAGIKKFKVANLLNLFHVNVPFLYPLKTLGGMKWEHWPEVGLK